MLVFKSSENYITVGLLWLIVILLLVVPFTAPTNEDTGIFDLIGFTILYVITGMLIWILLDTRYKIVEKKLFYASGPIRGSIKIEAIPKDDSIPLEKLIEFYESLGLEVINGNRDTES